MNCISGANLPKLVFGSTSLLERLKASLLRAKRSVDDWPQYLTLLNLRNWAKLGDRYVTEQIYVHTKLMIVDDRYVLHGSANINDRSLSGEGDSEIAVMIHDSQHTHADLDGSGNNVLTLNHARQLRKAVWRKLFGLDLKGGSAAGGAQAASELESVIDRPVDPKTVAAIRSVARANQEAYEAAFDWIPRNDSPSGTNASNKPVPSSIWPRWKYGKGETIRGEQTGLMPFEEKFWDQPQHTQAAASALATVRGFITELPIKWTQGENNNIGFAMKLVARNEQWNPANNDKGTDLAQNEAQQPPEQAGVLKG